MERTRFRIAGAVVRAPLSAITGDRPGAGDYRNGKKKKGENNLMKSEMPSARGFRLPAGRYFYDVLPAGSNEHIKQYYARS